MRGWTIVLATPVADASRDVQVSGRERKRLGLVAPTPASSHHPCRTIVFNGPVGLVGTMCPAACSWLRVAWAPISSWAKPRSSNKDTWQQRQKITALVNDRNWALRALLSPKLDSDYFPHYSNANAVAEACGPGKEGVGVGNRLVVRTEKKKQPQPCKQCSTAPRSYRGLASEGAGWAQGVGYSLYRVSTAARGVGRKGKQPSVLIPLR